MYFILSSFDTSSRGCHEWGYSHTNNVYTCPSCYIYLSITPHLDKWENVSPLSTAYLSVSEVSPVNLDVYTNTEMTHCQGMFIDLTNIGLWWRHLCWCSDGIIKVHNWFIFASTMAKTNGQTKKVLKTLCRQIGPSVTSWRLRNMMTSSNGNIFRVTGHLCGEFTGDRWIPRTKASDTELWCFLWSASE